ncbi:MAG: F0F1 ATP synthase subunit B [Bacteroidales bacterium]|nr:F0F1 ATP synthase subunit B [Candidatus Scybalousia scybalohippi]MCQ2327379.1 F0F1 ATP synthase subunit B [Bacteroidales bacterium]
MDLLTPGIGLIFWMTIIFLIVLFILGKWGWPVLIKSLKDREESIKKSLQAADKAKEEMANLQANNEQLLLQAKKERDQILKEAEQIKEQIIEEARNEAKKEADKITSSARENIIFEKNKAIDELKEKVSELSIDIAEKILQSELSDKKKSEQIIEREMEKIQL